MINFTFIFSYWILFWFILYYNKIIKFNPLFILYLAFIHNFYFAITTLKGLILYKYLFMIFIIKIIPIYLIYNNKIHIDDIIFSIILFLCYNLYLYINNTDINNIYNQINDSIINNKNDTLFFYIINLFYKH